MQNLVIGIISIALLIVTVTTGSYYLADAFENNKVKGESARYLNETSQVMGAITTYEAKGNEIGSSFSLQTLVDGEYLNHIPQGWSEYPDMIATPIVGSLELKEAVCVETNENAGFTFAPNGSDIKEYIDDPNKGIPYCSTSLDPAVPCCIYTE